MQSDELVRLGKLEEYKTMRAEVIALTARQGQQQAVTSGFSLALLTASWVSGQPELAILSVLFVVVAWRDALRLSTALYRLGEYISVAIEPYVPGLGWEGCVLDFHQKNVATRSIFSRVRVALTSFYGILAIISLVIFTAQLWVNWPENMSRQIVAGCLLVLGLLSLVRIVLVAIALPAKRGRYAKEFMEKGPKSLVGR